MEDIAMLFSFHKRFYSLILAALLFAPWLQAAKGTFVHRALERVTHRLTVPNIAFAVSIAALGWAWSQILPYQDELHSTVQDNLVDCVQFLLDIGLNPNAVDESGRRPLHEAASYSGGWIISRKVDNQGRTSSHATVYYRDGSKVTKRLLSAGAYVNAADKRGRTPLHEAVCYKKPCVDHLLLEGMPGVIQLLLDAGANPNARDCYGKTPLDLALEQGHEDVAKLLIAHGAKQADNKPIQPSAEIAL